MRISAQTLELINTLWELIQKDEGGPRELARELSVLPDFAGSLATAGWYVTPDGDIRDNHWWMVMDDGSVLDAAHEGGPVRCSKKDPRHKHYAPYTGGVGIPLAVLQLADHLKGSKRAAMNKTFTEMVEDMSVVGGVTQADLDAIEVYADRLFQKVGIDVAFTRHFIDRVNDPRNGKPITPAELVRLFKQTYKRHGKTLPRMGPEGEAVLRDMATDINVPFKIEWDPRSGMLDLVSKTIMRTPDFRTSDPVLAVEDGKVAPSDAPQDAAPIGGDVVPRDETDDQVRPEDMQLGWTDLLDEDDGATFVGYHCSAGPVDSVEQRGIIRAADDVGEIGLSSPADLWFQEILQHVNIPAMYKIAPDPEEDPTGFARWATGVETPAIRSEGTLDFSWSVRHMLRSLHGPGISHRND